jgi:hypothetical protein
MEMPITKPSMVSYADELNFNKLEDELTNKQHNGFIRVTAGSEEGFILYKNGKQVAASYDRLSKSEALEKIEFASAENNTLIEVFNIRPSQVDYLLELNQPYIIKEESKVPDVISELKETENAEKPVPEPVSEADSIQKVTVETGTEDTETETKITNLPKEQPEDGNNFNSSSGTVEEVKPESESVKTVSETSDETSVVTQELPSDTTEKSIKNAATPDPSPNSTSKEHEVDEGVIEIIPSQSAVDESKEVSSKIEEESQEEPLVDRSELLKKYGIKDVNEKDVENLLESYKGGSVSDDDAEKIELTLMNRIKKSVLGIPKIQATEVMVFLDNYRELTGTINIITEYESQGFFSRMMGKSKTIDNLRRQIINIAEFEIKKSFRQYPEVIDKFDINVEFS